MTDVYRVSAFEDRVNYAACCAVKGVSNGRHRDTCFEMGDGDYVAAALVRRVLKRPETKLASCLFNLIGRERAMQSYEETKHLNRAELRREANRVALEGASRSGYSNL